MLRAKIIFIHNLTLFAGGECKYDIQQDYVHAIYLMLLLSRPLFHILKIKLTLMK